MDDTKILNDVVCAMGFFNRKDGGIVWRGSGVNDNGLEKLVNKWLKSQKALLWDKLLEFGRTMSRLYQGDCKGLVMVSNSRLRSVPHVRVNP